MVDIAINLGNCLLCHWTALRAQTFLHPPHSIPFLPFPRISFLSEHCILQVAAKKSSSIPIQVAQKLECCKRSNNIFYNNRGFPDKTDKYGNRLHNINGGVILQHRKSPVPQLNVIDLTFDYEFNEALHGAQLARDLDNSPLDPTHAMQLTALIKQYWSVFDEHGTFIPVRG
jgi:hypothetical protein